MRHRINRKKLNLTSSRRKALILSLANGLIENKKITTTSPKAKMIKSVIEKYITKAKNPTLHNIRTLLSYLNNDIVVVNKLIEISKLFKERNGGYTKIIHIDDRLGDLSKMAIIEFVN